METQRIFEGKTVDHAIDEALKHYNCTREELEIEVITKGSTGIFGIGGRKAQIKVRYIPHEEVAPQDSIAPMEVVDGEEEMVEETSLSGEAQESLSPAPVEPQGREEGAPRGKEAEPFMEEAKEVLSELLRLSHLDASIETCMDPQDGPYLNIEGQDLSLVIGKNGQNLAAFKYVTNLIMKRRHSACPTIEVDAQGYLEKRRLQVESTARRMAEKAKRTGRSLSLEPMNAKERRIVHLAVKRIKGVTTKSVGEGEARRVVIFPKKRKGSGQGRGGSGAHPRQRRFSRQSNSRGRRH